MAQLGVLKMTQADVLAPQALLCGYWWLSAYS